MKKILVVVDSINIEDSSGSKANVALIQNLQASGFEVLVYHFTLKNIDLPGIKCYAIREIKYMPLYFLSRALRVIRRNFNKNFIPFFEKIFGFSFTYYNDTNSIAKALRKMDFVPNLVITLSKGASFRPHYAVLKTPELHDKWLAYVHDPYPFHYYPRPYNWVEPGYQEKEIFFRKVSEKAKYSGFPSQLLKEWMGSYFPDFLKTGIIIPHQNTPYTIKNLDFPSYFDPTKFNLLHAGNLMKQRSPEGLIEGFKLFLQNNPEAKSDARLLLLGPAEYHTEMLRTYQQNIPELYINNGNVPFDEVYNLQKNTTVNVILESKSEISPFLPAKFPHCVEANKPILSLAPYYSETRRLLGDSYPYWTEADAQGNIAEIIENIYQLWKQNSAGLQLNRPDLEEYVAADQLKKTIINLKTN